MKLHGGIFDPFQVMFHVASDPAYDLVSSLLPKVAHKEEVEERGFDT